MCVAILDEEQDGATNHKAMEGDPALPTSRVVCWVAQITRHGCDTKLCRKSPTTATPQAEAGPRLPNSQCHPHSLRQQPRSGCCTLLEMGDQES